MEGFASIEKSIGQPTLLCNQSQLQMIMKVCSLWELGKAEELKNIVGMDLHCDLLLGQEREEGLS